MKDREIIEPENPPAFPFGLDRANATHIASGMDLRDYFAAQAMQGLMQQFVTSSQAVRDVERIKNKYGFQTVKEAISHMAYEYAEAMLKTRQSD